MQIENPLNNINPFKPFILRQNMEKDIGKIPKNDTSEIVVRIDDFGGNRGLTIREFVTSERYTGFTKAGVRIKAEDFLKFREMINSIDLDEMTNQSDDGSKQETIDEAVEEKKEEEAKGDSDKKEDGDELPDY